MAADFSALEKKWLSRWAEAKVFEANPDKRPKFFVNFPYPYMNSLMHIGHFYTIMRVEALARYKRMRGYNVLFPQGWHCTGSPIENAAQRIREGEPKQIEIMKQLGLSAAQINEFADPKKWVEYFPKEAEKDLKALGLSVDWRRSFITTSLNPYYDKFIRWQFNKLKEKGYVVKGRHPVVWCSKDNSPVPDHSRVEGEGETPQEFTLLKFKFGKEFLVAATLRPETVFGQTNLWVNPQTEYSRAVIGNEEWIGSREFFGKLANQGHSVKISGSIKGKDLIGKKATAPLIGRELPILPAAFCDPSKGSGIVTSVPADAPDDYIGLRDLQQSEAECEKYGLDYGEVKAIRPIAIIDSKDLGPMAAVKIAEDMKIKSQNEREKLEEAKKIVYKKGFYEGVMNANTGKYVGQPVTLAKDKVKKELIEGGAAGLFYELTGKVVCRCLTDSIVKVVSDQWFIKYSDEEWKGQCRKALAELKLYPETSRQQFEYVVGWLNDWPCTREFGLGTNLPWDEKWVIESLSDSTIYMAFYTIAHKIKEIPKEKINDAFFDYVLLGKGGANGKGKSAAGKAGAPSGLLVGKKIADGLAAEFEYWYPVDFRNSGKDLIQNHLTFFLFNHAAVWEDPAKWPKGIGTNGWITVDGEKMSKSKGNFILLRELPERFGCDASRFAVLSGGEGLDDANFELGLAQSMNAKFSEWLEQTPGLIASGVDVPKARAIDRWFESELNRIIMEATGHMDEAMFKSALKNSFFELQRAIKWYLFRTTGKPEKALIRQAAISQILMLAPVAPFVSEELWEKLGGKGLACSARWPSFDSSKISKGSQQAEGLVQQTLDDVRRIRELAKIGKPKKVTVFTAPEWKWKAIALAAQACREKPDFGAVMKALVQDAEVKSRGREVEGFAKQAVKVAKEFLGRDAFDEGALLLENAAFFSRELGCEFVVLDAGSAQANKERAQKAFPLKPAILVE